MSICGGCAIANNISGNPWTIDTAPFSYPWPVKIDNIMWGNAQASETLQITDTIGRDLADIATPATWAGGVWTTGKLGWSNRGINITTLPAGAVVKIYVGAGK